jgi:hypothetical protein
LTDERKKSVATELGNLVQHLKNYKPVEVSYSLQIEQSVLPNCSYNNNHELQSASDCVELKYVPGMGRYIEATRDIQPGESSWFSDSPDTQELSKMWLQIV